MVATSSPRSAQRRFLFLQVEARHPARDVGWDVLGPEVEASLAVRTIEDPEFWQWKRAMTRRYEVDNRPLLYMVGEPIE